ncbi:MAG: HPr family phosphocarrier protein [Oscillospiraceae bacterium]
MKKITYVIRDELGLHARPAGMLVKMVQQMQDEVVLCKGGQRVNAGGIFAVLSLGAAQGEELVFEITGTGEEESAKAIADFCGQNL